MVTAGRRFQNKILWFVLSATFVVGMSTLGVTADMNDPTQHRRWDSQKGEKKDDERATFHTGRFSLPETPVKPIPRKET